MSVVILYIDAVSNLVHITKEGRQIPEFEQLYATDKTPGKKFFEAAITFIFYVCAKGEKGSPFQNQPFSHRCTLAAYEKIPGKKRDPDEFLDHPKVKNAIYAFNKYTKTQTELFEEKLFDDMDNTIKHLNSLSMTKKIIMSFEVNVGTAEEPKMEKRKQAVEFNNSEEKLKVYKNVKDILLLKKEYEELIRTEQIDKMRESEYLFERRESEA